MPRALIHLLVAAGWVRQRLARLPARGFAIFTTAFVLLEVIEVYVQPYTADGVHFQTWTSEFLMQSVSVRELRASPIETLWYLHIQPPIHNAIRAIFARWHEAPTWTDLIKSVDRDLWRARKTDARRPRGRDARFKFFLEPAIYVWWAAQFVAAARAVVARARRAWAVALADAVSPRAARDG